MPEKSIEENLLTIPLELRSQVNKAWIDYCAQCASLGLEGLSDQELKNNLCKVWASSRFVTENCVRNPKMLSDLLDSADLFSASARTDYRQYLEDQSVESEADLMLVLRLFRRREIDPYCLA